MMRMYDVSEEERKQTIEKILQFDSVKVGEEMFSKFVKKI